MNCLVTGGAGFIGSHLAQALANEGRQVRILDNFTTGNRDNIHEFIDKVELIEGSVTDPEVCRQACEGIDAVFHLAAISSVPWSITDPKSSHETNATGTLNMLLAARDAKVRRFVYSASASVYGDTPTLPTVELTPANPRSPYAVQKYLGELYCENFFKLFELETVSLRYFNVFGPRQDPHSPYGAVIPKFIHAVLSEPPPIVYGDGGQTRDFVYVDNVVWANVLALKAPISACGRVYNIACGKRNSLLELLECLFRLAGRRIEPSYHPSQPGDVRDSLAEITRAQKALGYQVKIEFEEGIKKTVEWYLTEKGDL